MNWSEYEVYLRDFNARNYDGVLSHYADRFELHFAGYIFRTKDEVQDFYRFFHSFVREEIRVSRYVSDADTVALEAVVQLTAERDLSPEALAAKGLGRLVALPAGHSVRMDQFVHYHLQDGKIVKAVCALAGDPEITAP